MSDLIATRASKLLDINSDSDFPVNGRDLHEHLKIGTVYTVWFSRMCDYGFEEGRDFNPVIFDRVQNEGDRLVTREVTDHQLTIGMAKELCMLQRNETGREVRRYLIEIENNWNTPEAVMARALKFSERKLLELHNKVLGLETRAAIDAPKVLFADSVAASNQSILVGELAKFLRQNGIEVGQNRLYKFLRNNGYLIKAGTSRNMPTQYSRERGLFEIKERTFNDPSGNIHITKTPKVTGKGQIYFVHKFLGGAPC